MCEREDQVSTRDHPSAAVDRPAPSPHAKRSVGWFLRGAWAWLTLKPGSRPRRMAWPILAGLAGRLVAHPLLADLLRRLLVRFPRLRERLRASILGERARRFHSGADSIFLGPAGELDLRDEPEAVRMLYQRLASMRGANRNA